MNMEILNSGSFVPLDNREKIDRLVYTARELASEVGRTEGFGNSGQTNHQLGLEMWKGAEYVCRAHEEANIRNLFLSKFLERLREIEKDSNFNGRSAQPTPVAISLIQEQAPAAPVSVPPPPEPPSRQAYSQVAAPTEMHDEYLGVVVPADEHNENDEHTDNTGSSCSDECLSEYDADIEALVDRLENERPEPEADGLPEQIGAEMSQADISATADGPGNESLADISIPVEQGVSSEVPAGEVHQDAAELAESASTGSIVISENEPYNFDCCTVTAVVQLLPETERVRKCVVSVRTHDFTPLVAISDVMATDSLSQISEAMRLAFEQYRNDLPAKAAEKLKKEKPVKKQAKSGSKSAKTATDQSKKAVSATTVAAAPLPQGQGGLFTS